MTKRASQSAGWRSWIDAGTIGVAAVIAIGAFGWLIADYEANLPSCELANRMYHGTGRDAPASWRDVGRAFDWYHLEMRVPRARFSSYFVEIINFRFRLFLWQYVTPHPTLSIVWLFSLASLAVLYLAARELGYGRAAAASCVVIYGSSIGFLSGIAYLNHPARPMINVFIIAAIYVYSRLSNRTPGRMLANASPWAIILVALLVVPGLFFDESGILLFAIIPVLCPLLFIPRRTLAAWKKRPSFRHFARRLYNHDLRVVAKNGLLFLLPAFGFAVCLVVVIPLIIFFLGYMPYSFFSAENVHLSSPRGLSILAVPINLFSLLAPSLLIEIGGGQDSDVLSWVVPERISWHSGTVAVLFIVFFFASAWDWFRRRRALLMKMAAALTVALVFVTVFFYEDTIGGTCTGFYYANQFSIFFALFAGLLLNPSNRWLGALGKVVLIALVVIQSTNAHQMCRESRGGGCYFDELAVAHNIRRQAITAAYPQIEPVLSTKGTNDEIRALLEQAYPHSLPGTKQEVAQIWQAWRQDRSSVESIKEPISRSSYWVICELTQINRIDRKLSADAP